MDVLEIFEFTPFSDFKSEEFFDFILFSDFKPGFSEQSEAMLRQRRMGGDQEEMGGYYIGEVDEVIIYKYDKYRNIFTD